MQTTQAASNDIPRDEINERAKVYEQARIRITRQDSKGHWMTLCVNVVLPFLDLLSIDGLLMEWAGGGNFRIEVTDPNNVQNELVKPFYVRIDHPVRPYVGPGSKVEAGGGGGGGGAQYMPPGSALTPGRFAGPSETALNDPRRYWHKPPDAIAEEHASRDRRAHEKQQQRWEEEKRDMLRKQEALEQRTNDLLSKMQQQEREHEKRQFQLQIEALKENGGRSKIDFVGLAGALAPVVIAMISGTRETAQLAAQNNQAAQSQSSELMKTVLLAQLSKGDGLADMIKHIAPLAAGLSPLIAKWIDGSSPEKTAKLMSTLGEQIMQQTSMASDMIRLMGEQQSGDPAWLGVVNQLAGGLERMGQYFVDRNAPGGAAAVVSSARPTGDGGQVIDIFEQRRAAAAQPVMAPMPTPRQVQQPQQPQPGQVVPAQPAAQNGTTPAPAPNGVDGRVEAMNAVMHRLPRHLQTQEWAAIVYHLLGEEQDRIITLAQMIVSQVEHLVRFQLLPAELDELQGLSPDAFDQHFLALLPLTTEYRNAMLQALSVVGSAGGPVVSGDAELARVRSVRPPPRPAEPAEGDEGEEGDEDDEGDDDGAEDEPPESARAIPS